MAASVSNAVSHALAGPSQALVQHPDAASAIDLHELQDELDQVAEEALMARGLEIPLSDAVHDPRFEALRSFHQDLRDALFVEIPSELEPWIQSLHSGPANSGTNSSFGGVITRLAMSHTDGTSDDDDHRRSLQRALAELMVFEAVRLRLLLNVWQNEDFDRLGGEERDIDEIAWDEVHALLAAPELADPQVRPLQLIYAAASVSLAREAAGRADELRMVNGDVRDELTMRARLRAALRQLRLSESVLLENALSGLLGGERQELRDLQESRPLALEGLSRQAMDQRVSRGRRALTRPAASWPRRRRPALVDLLAEDGPALTAE